MKKVRMLIYGSLIAACLMTALFAILTNAAGVATPSRPENFLAPGMQKVDSQDPIDTIACSEDTQMCGDDRSACCSSRSLTCCETSKAGNTSIIGCCPDGYSYAVVTNLLADVVDRCFMTNGEAKDYVQKQRDPNMYWVVHCGK